MIPRKNPLLGGGYGAKPPAARTHGHPQPQKPVLVQPKMQSKIVSASPLMNRPPVSQPQPAPKTVQPKIASVVQARKRPVAPPVQYTQPAPKVSQRKTAGGQPSQVNRSSRQPFAPPVNRLDARNFVQPKMAATAQVSKPAAGVTAQASKQPAATAKVNRPQAAPVYRPQAAPRVLQTKARGVQPTHASPQPPRPSAARPLSSTVQAKLSNTIQAAFSPAGLAARNRVNLVTGGANAFDPYGGFTFAQWHPHGARIGFDQAIVAHVVANAPHDNLGPPNWYTCPYCNFEYPLNRMQVDHIIPWAAYSAGMTTAGNINAARAWEVYVGCNDPANLRLACDSCNASKGQNAPTAIWIGARQALALAQGGF